MYNIKALKEERASLEYQQKDLYARAEKEGREVTADEMDQFDTIEKRYTELTRQIQQAEAVAAKLAKEPAPEQRQEAKPAEYKDVFWRSMRYGMDGLSSEERAIMGQHFQRGTDPQTTTDAAGGYTIPQGFSNELFVEMAQWGGMLQAGRIFNTSTGNAIDWPTVDDTSVTGALLAEANAAVVSDMTFANKTLNAYTYTSNIVKITMELMQDSAFDLEAFLREAFARRLGTAINAALTTGDGSAKPQGVIPAATAYSTGVGAAALTRDNLVDLVHQVDPAYRPGAIFMMNDATLGYIKKLAFGTSDDRPLWQPSIREGEPDRLEGYRYIINQSMADIGASAKSVAFGDFSKYIIRIAGPATMLRLNERYAEYLHTGFIAYQRVDGELLSANAIKVLQHAAS